MLRRLVISTCGREPPHYRRSSHHEKFLPPVRSLHWKASLLRSRLLPAGVGGDTSRYIRPRVRDLRDLRLFVLMRGFTRPTHRPRHAGRISHYQSKPLRPLNKNLIIMGEAEKQAARVVMWGQGRVPCFGGMLFFGNAEDSLPMGCGLLSEALENENKVS
jgi:hypothetical protein